MRSKQQEIHCGHTPKNNRVGLSLDPLLYPVPDSATLGSESPLSSLHWCVIFSAGGTGMAESGQGRTLIQLLGSLESRFTQHRMPFLFLPNPRHLRVAEDGLNRYTMCQVNRDPEDQQAWNKNSCRGTQYRGELTCLFE